MFLTTDQVWIGYYSFYGSRVMPLIWTIQICGFLALTWVSHGQMC
jgi:hypothetical protein